MKGSLGLTVRLVALALVAVVVQESAISQISIFGVSADITPLVVMSVGLLAGSMPGAIFGFATGLLVDTVLVQTLGITSLLYIPIGYWSGRLREVRDPAHGLVPLAAGAAATAVAGIGMSLIQFLLGVDAPVSLLLLQQIFITVLVNTLIALPVYAIVRKVVLPALPDDPRRRRRRAYTTGGLSPLQQPSRAARPDPAELAMIQLPEDRRPPMTPQLALRVTIVGSCALAMFAIIFFRLWFLQVLSGDQYLSAATVNRVRDVAIAAPRGEILSSSGVRAGRLDQGARGPDLGARPAAVLGQPRPGASCSGAWRACWGSRPRKIKCRVAGPPPTGGTFRGRADPVRRQAAARAAALRRRRPSSRRQQVRPVLPGRAPAAVPRRAGRPQVYMRPATRRATSRRSCSGTVGRITAQECWDELPEEHGDAVHHEGLSWRRPQRGHRAGRPGRGVRPLPARASTDLSRSRSTPSASRPAT